MQKSTARCLLDELEINGLIHKSESPFGKRVVMVYKPTQKGIDFCRSILEPYERMFPRKKESVVNVNYASNNNDYIVKLTRKTVGSREEEIEIQQQQKLQSEVSEQTTAY